MSWFPLGHIEVARIIESNAPFWRASKMFAEATPEALEPDLEWLEPDVICPDTGRMVLPIQGFVVRTRHHTVLVDTCVGNHKTCKWHPAWNDCDSDVYLAGMTARGVHPEQVDFVVCTHLHIDHIGWNTRLIDGAWRPTFPNARYLFTRTEYEFAEAACRAADDHAFAESVAPVMDAGNGVLVDTDHEIDESLRLEHTPGHTPGHVAVRLSSGGHAAVMPGDLIQSPLQCRHPEWNFIWDNDQELARRTRRRFLEDCCESNAMVLTSHFPLPSVGVIRPRDDAFRFENVALA